MTKKERNKRYKKAKRIFESFQFSRLGLCSHLDLAGFLDPYTTRESCPEFKLFEPSTRSIDIDGYWWPRSILDEEERNIRLIVLDFCIAMTE